MAFYDEMQAMAAELIAEFGQAAAIRRIENSGPPYDPVQTTTDHACTLVVMEIDLSKIDATVIQMSDRMAYVSTDGLTIEPTTADQVVLDGTAHAIKMVKPSNPAGTITHWEVYFAN